MNFDDMAKNIRKLYAAISGKADNDVVITYKGTSYGVSEPWHVHIDVRENSAASLEEALTKLLLQLKSELQMRVASAEKQAREFRQTLSNMEN